MRTGERLMPQLPTTTVETPWLILHSMQAGPHSTARSSCVCASMKPGATAFPVAITSRSAEYAPRSPTATMRSPVTPTSPLVRAAPVPSKMVASRRIRSQRKDMAGPLANRVAGIEHAARRAVQAGGTATRFVAWADTPRRGAASRSASMSDQPVVAGKAPIKIAVEAGKDYWWCSCGKSAKQPFCDGSHKGSSFAPMKYTADKTGDAWFCACKGTGKSPLCDGAHKKL
jgi:CDGSH-type Zn-finger protein